MGVLFHFSEDDSIERFDPHVPATNPTQAPAVWAIDEAHAPLYWFPRDCPRITLWPRNDAERVDFESTFATTANRLHIMEYGWLRRLMRVRLYQYDFDDDTFEPWAEASGQWISAEAVTPLRVAPVGDLAAKHEAAGIELRLVDRLQPLVDRVVSDRWDFSLVRMANAT